MKTEGRIRITDGVVTRVRDRRAATWIIGFSTIVAVIEASVALLRNESDAGLVELVRVTARTSVVWFALAFAAGPLVALRPATASKWLLRNRRYLGLAMAVSHGAHLVGILALAGRLGAEFWRMIAPTTLVGGGLGYVILALMVATSSDRAVAWLGRRNWRALHLTGMWFFWSIFTFTYLGQVGRSVFASVALASLVALAGLRILARSHRAARRRARSAT